MCRIAKTLEDYRHLWLALEVAPGGQGSDTPGEMGDKGVGVDIYAQPLHHQIYLQET